MSQQFKPKRLDVIEACEERLKFYKQKEETELYKLDIARFLYILAYCYYHSKGSKLDKVIIKDIKKKYRKNYQEYCKVNSKLSKEKIKYGLIYLIPNLVFVLPVI